MYTFVFIINCTRCGFYWKAASIKGRHQSHQFVRGFDQWTACIGWYTVLCSFLNSYKFVKNASKMKFQLNSPKLEVQILWKYRDISIWTVYNMKRWICKKNAPSRKDQDTYIFIWFSQTYKNVLGYLNKSLPSLNSTNDTIS